MNVGLISLGCPKNLVDSEIMLGMLSSNGYDIKSDLEECDAIIINTCGFINDAKEESINTILELAELKKTGACKYLVVTGCLAERYSEEIIDEIEEVDYVLGTAACDEIVNVLKSLEKGSVDNKIIKKPQVDCSWLEEDRIITTNKGMAYLKISEGCDNNCTYCIIPKLRGTHRSRKIDDIYNEAVKLCDNGVKEIILLAQDTTCYGKDLYGRSMLVELIKKLSKIESLRWIRILYCYPEGIGEDLIEELATNPKLIKYIDIPIQHISNNMLKRMGRKTSKENIYSIINKLREAVKDIVIRSTFIVGFPGECDEDFEQLLEFTKEIKLDRLGVFAFSREEGTPAYRLKPLVDEDVAEARRVAIMEEQEKISYANTKDRIGRVYEVLVEGIADDGIFYTGRSFEYAPEIDGCVYITSEEPLAAGDMVKVKILNNDNYDLIGAVEDEFAE